MYLIPLLMIPPITYIIPIKPYPIKVSLPVRLLPLKILFALACDLSH